MIAYRCHLEMPMTDTGMPPRIRIPKEAKPASSLPPYPSHGPSKEIWKETEHVLRSMTASRSHPAAEYGSMPDGEDEQVWNPGEKDWLPELPY
jgi:hypothetical protein